VSDRLSELLDAEALRAELGVTRAAAEVPEIPAGALLITTRETAGLLRVSPETVLRWYRTGKLPGGRRLGSNVLRFDRSDVEAWLEGTGPERTLVAVRGSE
jgi:excisionase family DNA binding protein